MASSAAPGNGNSNSRTAPSTLQLNIVDSRTLLGLVYALAIAASEVPSVATVKRRRLNALGTFGSFSKLMFYATLAPIGLCAKTPCRVALCRRPPVHVFSAKKIRPNGPMVALHCRHVHVLRYGVLTRTQVARRLGRSVATVRRIEGVLLFPATDARGVHRFRDTDVDALAENVKRGRVKLVDAMRSAYSGKTIVRGKRHMDCPGCRAKDEELRAIHAELSWHKQELEASLVLPGQGGARQRNSDITDLAIQVADLLATINS